MNITDLLLSVFRWFRRRPDFASIPPDDLEAFWRAEHAIDQAGRRDPASLAQVLATYGLRDGEHWERVRQAFNDRHADNPDLGLSRNRVHFELQLAEIAKVSAMPQEAWSPPHGITVDRYAIIRARVDAGADPAAVLSSYRLDGARWREVESTWDRVMRPEGEMSAQIFRSFYESTYQQARTAWGAR